MSATATRRAARTRRKRKAGRPHASPEQLSAMRAGRRETVGRFAGAPWPRVATRVRAGGRERAGRKRGFAPRRRSKLLQFLNSRSPGQRHDPPKPRASMPFGKVSAGFATVLRREPSPRFASAENTHRGGQLGLWCSPMFTPIRWILGVCLWVSRTILTKIVNQYNHFGGGVGGGRRRHVSGRAQSDLA